MAINDTFYRFPWHHLLITQLRGNYLFYIWKLHNLHHFILLTQSESGEIHSISWWKMIKLFFHFFDCKFLCFWVGISYNQSRYFLKYFLIVPHLFQHFFLVEFLMHPFQLLYINCIAITLLIYYLYRYLTFKEWHVRFYSYCILIRKYHKMPRWHCKFYHFGLKKNPIDLCFQDDSLIFVKFCGLLRMYELY